MSTLFRRPSYATLRPLKSSLVLTVSLLLEFALWWSVVPDLNAQDFTWLKSGGGPREDKCIALAVDNVGNLVTVGEFNGSATFSGASITSLGGAGSYVAKYSPNGDLLMLKGFSNSSGSVNVWSVATDAGGNIYMFGTFFGPVSFGQITLDHVSPNGNDFFVKLSSDGETIWAKSFRDFSGNAIYPGAFYSSGFKSITIDALGNIHCVSAAKSLEIGDTQIETDNIYQVYNATFTPEGGLLWHKELSATRDVIPIGSAADKLGNTYVYGAYSGAPRFGVDRLSTTQNVLEFLAKFNFRGDLVWAVQPFGSQSIPGFVGSSSPIGGIAIGPTGNCVISSEAGGVFEFAPDGTQLRKLGRTAVDAPPGAVAVDESGNIDLTFAFTGRPQVFDRFSLFSQGDLDICVLSFLPNSSMAVRQAGAAFRDYPTCITTDPAGNIYIGGVFLEATQMGRFAVVGNGNEDAFIAKIGNNTVPILPQVLTPPLSQTFPPGKDLALFVQATGLPPLGYQWQFNGTNLVVATNASLLLTNVQFSHAGLYDVIVHNSSGSVTSSIASIAIQANAPIFGDAFVDRGILNPFTNYVAENSSLFSKEPGEPAHAGRKGAHSGWLTWTAPGSGICVIDTFGSSFDTVLAAYTGDTLTNLIEVASNDDMAPDVNQSQIAFQAISGAAYQFAVDGYAPDDFGDIRFHLSFSNSVPIITQQPARQGVLLGSSATFQVQALGALPLVYHWFFNDSEIVGAHKPQYTIDAVDLSAAGRYWVVVGNDFGSTTSLVAELIVFEPPRISQSPQSLSIPVGANAEFSVEASGSSPLSYQWQVGNVDISLANSRTLRLTNIQFLQAGSYSVIVSNAYSVATSAPASLTIRAPLTVLTEGAGAIIRSPDRDFYDLGQLVTVTATPDRYYVFNRWTDGATENPRLVTIGTSNAYKAVFGPSGDLETLTYGGVTRTAPTGAPAVFVDGEFVINSSRTNFSPAFVEMRSTFDGATLLFTLDGSEPNLSSTLYTGPLQLRDSAVLRVVAYDKNFTRHQSSDPIALMLTESHRLTATSQGGGTIVVDPDQALFPKGATIKIAASPAPGWTFQQWLGGVSGVENEATVTMDSDQCVEAIFGTPLDISVVGQGKVYVDPPDEFLSYSSDVRLTALPDPGYFFSFWSGALSSTNNPIELKVTNANPRIIAGFAPLTGSEVSLTISVRGAGRVLTSPTGNRFRQNQSVTLVAIPAEDQIFQGWSGAATSSATVIHLVLTESGTVAAEFTARPRLEIIRCGQGETDPRLRLDVTGRSHQRYKIESTDKLTSEWSIIREFTPAGPRFQIDIEAPGPFRFFRAAESP